MRPKFALVCTPSPFGVNAVFGALRFTLFSGLNISQRVSSLYRSLHQDHPRTVARVRASMPGPLRAQNASKNPMCLTGVGFGLLPRFLRRAKCLRGFGGPGEIRTHDLFHAMEARSQLRHRPAFLYFNIV